MNGRAKRLLKDLDQEIREHIELATQENIERGMAPKDARYAAMQKFGNVTLVKEDTKDVWSTVWFEQVSQDIRFALHQLRKSPAFAAVAILTLAFGTGANTALFSIVNGVLLNPLSYPQPEQLVEVAAKSVPFSESSISYPNLVDWIRDNRSFTAIAGYRSDDVTLTASGEAQHIKGMRVSASFFSLLGVKPLIGRNFTADEDRQGAAPVVILSQGLWKSKFGSSLEILGKALTLNGKAYTVVGVIPSHFYFCCEATNFHLGEAYFPIGSWENTNLHERGDHMGIYAVGRLKPGVTVEQARDDMDRVAQALALLYPEVDKNEGVWIMPLKQRMVQDVKPMLLILLGAVGFVLLIACANVANLLLARSTGRAREFAIRSVLGATQGRIIRQSLTESLLLSIAGGGLGLLFASWGTRAGLKLLPDALPRANDVQVDSRVLFFTLTVSILAGTLFGLTPALRARRSDLQRTLKEGGRGASGVRHRLQAAFVVVQLALAVVLLIGAGLTIRSLASLLSVNPGFNPKDLLTFTVTVPFGPKATPDEMRENLRRLAAEIAVIPGVQFASLTEGAQPMNGDDEWQLWIEGQPKPQSRNEMLSALSYIVSPSYWDVMQIPLVRGRLLTERDDAHASPVCVIDENFAKQYFPNQDPIGQRLNINDTDRKFEIVGVVGHVNQWGLDADSSAPVTAQLYTLLQQLPDKWITPSSFNNDGFVVRTAAPGNPSADTIRKALQQTNSELVAYDFAPMDQIISDSLAARRFTMVLLAIFAAVAVLLASIGIYGVVSYVVGQRTNEIGIRMALGAERQRVLLMVLSQAGRLVILGVFVGLLASFGLTRLMNSILFGVSSYDPLTFLGVALTLSLVALLACYLPARRASSLDPMSALRYE
jgi:predicted permease